MDVGGAALVGRDLHSRARKVDVRLPGKGNSNSHGTRLVYIIMTMMKWIRTSRLSIKTLSLHPPSGGGAVDVRGGLNN